MGTCKNTLQYFATWTALVLFIPFFLSSCTTPSIVATQAIQQGDLYNNQHKYNEAIVAYEKYLQTSPQLGMYRNMSMEADVSRKLAFAYSTQGNYNKSLTYLDRALGIDSSLVNNKLEVIEDYRQVGVTCAYLGKYELALKNLNMSLKLNEGMEGSLKDVKKLSIADTYMSLAQVHLTIGNYQDALKFTNEALELYDQVPTENLGKIEANLALGILLRETDHMEEGMEHLKISLDLAEKNDYGRARQWQAIGEIHGLKGDYNEYLTYMLKALDEAERTRIKAQVIWANIRVGDAYEKIGDKEKARFYYNESLKLQREAENDTTGMLPSINMRLGDVQQSQEYFLKSGSKIGAALASYQLGQLKLKDHKTDSALYYFKIAGEIFNEIGVVEGEFVVNTAVGNCIFLNGDLIGAKDMFYSTLQKTIQPELKWQLWYSLGQVLEKENQFDSAYSAFDESIKLIESIRGNLSLDELRSKFFNDKIKVYDRLIMLVLNHSGDIQGIKKEEAAALAFIYCERARSRSFLDMLGNTRLAPKVSGDEDIMYKEQTLKLKIQKIYQELQKADLHRQDKIDLQTELEKTETEFDNTVQKLKLINKDYRSVVTAEPPDLKQIMASLDAGTCLVEYWMSEENLVIWVISNTQLKYKIVPVPEKDIVNEIKRCRRLISMEMDDLTEESLHNLSKFLIDPVISEINNFKNLVVIPHRALHFVPFQALFVDNRYLVEIFNILYSPSSAVYLLCTEKIIPQGDTFLGMALGNYQIGSFATLPGTESEINHISQVYQNMIRKTGNDITESFLKQNAGSYNFLHLATHGYFNKNRAMYSYILLSPDNDNDGQLTVKEIFEMNMKADLVTLSACETGLGDITEGDELVGLSRAFIYAGTPAVIVSLWTVDDVTTSVLMTRFYQYLNSGLSANESLSMAQRDLLQNNFTASGSRGLRSVKWDINVQSRMQIRKPAQSRNPYYWAPFVLIGNGNIK